MIHTNKCTERGQQSLILWPDLLQSVPLGSSCLHQHHGESTKDETQGHPKHMRIIEHGTDIVVTPCRHRQTDRQTDRLDLVVALVVEL